MTIIIIADQKYSRISYIYQKYLLKINSNRRIFIDLGKSETGSIPSKITDYLQYTKHFRRILPFYAST